MNGLITPIEAPTPCKGMGDAALGNVITRNMAVCIMRILGGNKGLTNAIGALQNQISTAGTRI